MNAKFLLIAAVVLIPQPAFSQQSSQVAGTWNVSSIYNGDGTVANLKKGEILSYIWIISMNPNGDIQVNVQGETKFPKLTGIYNPSTKTMILEARGTVGLNVSIASWFKLYLTPKGEMRGIRRFLSNSSDGPVFADFEITAKRQ